MAKIVINNATGMTSINANFDKVESEFNTKVLYRDNPDGEPNEMLNNLDMNENRILNLPQPLSANEPARLQDILDNIVTYPSVLDDGVMIDPAATTMNFTGSGVTVTNEGEGVKVDIPSILPTLAAPGGAALIGNTPSGNIASTTVQAALNELDSEKASLSDLASSGAALIGRNVQIVDSIAALQSLLKTSPSKYAETTGYYTAGGGGGGVYWLDVSDTTSAHNGSTVIVATDGGRWKLVLNKDITLRQFGARGDDASNDSTPILSAIVYMIATGKNVYVEPGIYQTDPFSLFPSTYASQGNFYGNDRERTTLKRRSAGAGDFVTIGGSSGTIFQSGLVFRGMTFDGGATTNGDTFVSYDLVRSRLENCAFTGGRHAVQMYGGISVTFEGCLFNNSKRGFQAEKFTSLAGGGWPNIIRINNSEIVDNTEFGVWFNNGRMLILDNTEVEGNGTTLAAAEGGVYIGPNVGEEVSGSDTFSIGLIARGCWFEANKGIADIRLDSGVNAVYDSNFFSTSVQVTNDVRIDGGRYDLKNVNMSFSKTANVLENAGAQIGNNIETSDIPNINVNSSKTTVYGSNKITTRGGVVPVYQGLSIPLFVAGNSNTAAGATVTVNFGVTFASVPKVFTQVHNGDSATTLLQIVVSNITTTGFDARCLSITSGSSTISSVLAGFNWEVHGTL